jgi:integrase
MKTSGENENISLGSRIRSLRKAKGWTQEKLGKHAELLIEARWGKPPGALCPSQDGVSVRHVSFHSLRHTNASLRIRAEQNIKYMSMQMGHSSVKMTLDTYGHLFNDKEYNRQQVDLLQATF